MSAIARLADVVADLSATVDALEVRLEHSQRVTFVCLGFCVLLCCAFVLLVLFLCLQGLLWPFRRGRFNPV